MKKFLLAIISLVFLVACKATRPLIQEDKTHFTGIYVADSKTGEMLLRHHEKVPFVPASNTKILTLYACLQTLGDSLPAFRYFTRRDTLFILGTGDPTLLHPDFPESAALRILKNARAIVLSDQHVHQPRYGEGWAWDDYNDYYQAEIGALPLYGNVVRAHIAAGELAVQPPIFPLKDSTMVSNKVLRSLFSNHFYYNSSAPRPAHFRQEIPFRTSLALTAKLLSDTLKIPVSIGKFEPPAPLSVAYSHPVDTVLRKMMQQSDNLLAEQLLLVAGSTLSDTLSTAVSIQHIRKLLLGEEPLPYRWRDGSGLSRYNLLSPETLVRVLNQMFKSFPEERLFSLMAIGGKAGTLKSKYRQQDIPYVFAKSGSMSGVYNESGFLIARSGRRLTYSIMKNNFTNTVAENGKETMELVERLRERF